MKVCAFKNEVLSTLLASEFLKLWENTFANSYVGSNLERRHSMNLSFPKVTQAQM